MVYPEVFCVKCNSPLNRTACGVCGKNYVTDGGVFDFIGGHKTPAHLKEMEAEKDRLDGASFSRLLTGIVREHFKGFFGSVIDVGCGTGYYSHRIFLGMNDVYVTGLDINSCFDESLVSEHYRFVRADIFNIPFKPESFDAAVSFDVIEHVEDDAGFVSRIISAIKPGGFFVIGTPNLERLTSVVRSVIKGKRKFPFDYGKSGVLGDTVHIREYSADGIAELFDKITDIAEYKIIPVLFGINLKKKILGIGRPGLKGLGRFAQYWVVAGHKGLKQ